MKRVRIGLAIILSLMLIALICPAVQADDQAGVDLSATVALTISDVSASRIGYHGATISWKTNGDATSQVFYDTGYHQDIADYAYHTEDTALVSEHSIRLTGLSSGTTYHYRVRSAIPDTEFIAISDDYTFKTLTPAPPPPEEPAPPTYYIQTNLFGTEENYPISSTGEIQETIEGFSEDGMLPITIPEGTIALDKDGNWLESLEVTVEEDPPAPPEDAYIIGLAYNFGPDRATFDPAITLTWSYDPDALPEGVDEESLVIAYYDEELEWVELDCVVDTENNTITASLEHFTTFAIIGTIKPAAFILSSLSISPAEVNIGESVTISAIVANTGGMSGSHMVTLKIDGVVEASEEVTISAGASKKVAFTTTKDVAGTYSVDVDGLSASFTVASLAPPAPAVFSVSNLSIQPAEVEAVTAVTIAVLVDNIGGMEGSYTVVLEVNGVKEAEKTVTIAAGDSQEVGFSLTRDEPGTYSVSVDGLSGGFTVVVVAKPPPNWPFIGGIIALAVLVAVLIFFIVRRRI